MCSRHTSCRRISDVMMKAEARPNVSSRLLSRALQTVLLSRCRPLVSCLRDEFLHPKPAVPRSLPPAQQVCYPARSPQQVLAPNPRFFCETSGVAPPGAASPRRWMRQAENQRVAFEKRSSVLAPKSGCQTAAVSLKKTFPRQFGNHPCSSKCRIRPPMPTAAPSPRRARCAHNPTCVGHVLLFFFQLLSPARRPQGTSLISFLSRHQR